ncbi:hypothetical protein [Lichenicoccus sp.]|uniref:hypothetical protein n=1 Tax=Lichenicoccus sp. TaxID=2781899 RepID=UPI003D13743E
MLAAADRIGFYAAGLIRQRLEAQAPVRRLGFVLQQRSAPFYQALGAALRDAVLDNRAIRGQPVIEYLDDLTPAAVAACLRRIGSQADALALVAADHAHVTRAIDDLHGRGIPVFALLSDLTAVAASMCPRPWSASRSLALPTRPPPTCCDARRTLPGSTSPVAGSGA